MTVLSIMDRDGWDKQTDNIVVVDPSEKSLTWVPRDLWCPPLEDRINRAFARGSHACLVSCLRFFHFEVDTSICFQPVALKPLFDKCSIEVPVPHPMQFFYPLRRDLPIEEGSKRISFHPPKEHLSGERIHQWVGARMSADGRPYSDLNRMRRQQVLIRSLLEANFELLPVNLSGVSFSSDQSPYRDLASVTAEWRFGTFGEGCLKDVMIQRKQVLVYVGVTRGAC